MTNVEFTPAEMQTVMMAIDRVCMALLLTDSDEHLFVKSRVSALIIECAEGGERDLQKLVDCAHEGLRVAV